MMGEQNMNNQFVKELAAIIMATLVVAATYVVTTKSKAASPNNETTITAGEDTPIGLSLPLVKKWEGFRAKPYLCPAGKLTVGYGTRTDSSRSVSRKEAEQMLVVHLQKECVSVVNQLVEDMAKANSSIKLNNKQQAALLSLVYNVGSAAFNRSRCRQAFVDGRLSDAIHEWLDFNRVNGKFCQGLYNRRCAEVQRYFSE
jgi:lysozyme